MLENKIVKRLDQRTYCQKLQQWLAQLPFFLRIGIVMVTATTIYCLVTCPQEPRLDLLSTCQKESRHQHTRLQKHYLGNNHQQWQLLIFYGIVISNLYGYEAKGSTPFIMGVLIRSSTHRDLVIPAALTSHFLSVGLNLYLHTEFYMTSVPVLVGLLIVSQDSLSPSDVNTNFVLGLPFQIKKTFYPAVVIILLEVLHTRVDVVPAYLIGLLLCFMQFKGLMERWGRAIEKPLCCCLTKYECFMKIDQQILQEKPLQHVTTSNSVVFADI